VFICYGLMVSRFYYSSRVWSQEASTNCTSYADGSDYVDCADELFWVLYIIYRLQR